MSIPLAANSLSRNEFPLDNIKSLLQRMSIDYRILPHRPAGNTIAASVLRQHDLREAAKSIVLRGKNTGDSVRQYLHVVVSGDRFVDVTAIKAKFGIMKVGFVDSSELFSLTGCISGAVPPFSFNESVKLIVDRSIQHSERLIFNAGRLDLSIEISSAEYIKKISPLLHDVSILSREA